MLSKRPYLLQALYDWIVDQGHVPHIVVDANVEGAQVPAQYVQDGQIQLNVGPTAVRSFLMDRSALSFEARFGGVPFQVYVPMRAILAIFDRDSGNGMAFEAEPDEEFPGEEASASAESPIPLHVADESDDSGSSASEDEDGAGDGDGPDDPSPGGGGKRSGPSLRLVK